MKPAARRLVSTAQGLLVGTGVVWLVTLAERNAVVSITEVMPLQFCLAVAVNALALCLMGIRLQLVLRAARLALPTRTALRLHFQSVFYLFVLPFGVGADLEPRQLVPDHGRNVNKVAGMGFRPHRVADLVGDSPAAAELHAARRHAAHLGDNRDPVAAFNESALDASQAELNCQRKTNRPAAGNQNLRLIAFRHC